MATKIRLRPTFDRILVKRDDAQTEAKNGIIIPDVSVSKPNQGVIVDMGPYVFDRTSPYPGYEEKRVNLPQLFAIGDTVQIAQYAGVEMGIDGDTYVLVKQDEILTIVETVEVPDTLQVETIEQ